MRGRLRRDGNETRVAHGGSNNYSVAHRFICPFIINISTDRNRTGWQSEWFGWQYGGANDDSIPTASSGPSSSTSAPTGTDPDDNLSTDGSGGSPGEAPADPRVQQFLLALHHQRHCLQVQMEMMVQLVVVQVETQQNPRAQLFCPPQLHQHPDPRVQIRMVVQMVAWHHRVGPHLRNRQVGLQQSIQHYRLGSHLHGRPHGSLPSCLLLAHHMFPLVFPVLVLQRCQPMHRHMFPSYNALAPSYHALM